MKTELRLKGFSKSGYHIWGLVGGQGSELKGPVGEVRAGAMALAPGWWGCSAEAGSESTESCGLPLRPHTEQRPGLAACCWPGRQGLGLVSFPP